ncbi:MAG: sigma-70 family RNA polymerase sigma factor [Thermoleophilaceae bacterium]
MTPRSLLHPARLARKPVLSSQSDERLVDLVRAGYEPAFETIVERYRRPLTRYVRGILPGERAEDAVQQSFVNAYEAIRREDAELKLRPWLYRIAHNTALNGLRDRALAEQPLDERLDGVERPDQAFERRQGLAQVIAAVQELPERQRDAIVLRELEGRSYEEISAALGVTGGAVRQLLHRARNALRTAATAATPVGLLTRIPWAVPGEPVGARVADLCGVGAAAGAGALAGKVCATAVVTGAVISGVAVGPGGGDDRRQRGVDQAQAADRDSGPAGAAAPAGLATGAGGDSRRGASASGDDGRGGDGRGQAGDDSDDRGHGDYDRRNSNSREGDGSEDDRGERVEEVVERDGGGEAEGPGRAREGHDDDGGGENRGEGGRDDDEPPAPDEDRSGSGESGGGDGSVARSGSGVPGGGSGSGSGPEVSGASPPGGGESGSSGSGSGSSGGGSGSSGSGSNSGPGSGSDQLEEEAD